mmetsp:Transcript_35318/g.77192  ORF Transcript_35318/g.77192 Transcript_35318/m.77192 type:complete len:465 (-) Transcript_35318:64-1458(-)
MGTSPCTQSCISSCSASEIVPTVVEKSKDPLVGVRWSEDLEEDLDRPLEDRAKPERSTSQDYTLDTEDDEVEGVGEVDTDSNSTKWDTIPSAKSYFLINSLVDNDDEGGGLSPMQNAWTRINSIKSSEDREGLIEATLSTVERCVDVEYDILKAEVLLNELEDVLGPGAQWNKILQSEIFERFRRKLDYFHRIGRACCHTSSGWFRAYEGGGGTQSIYGRYDPNNSLILEYRARVEIPERMCDVLAIANEVQLMPLWNSLVVNTPEVLGRRTAHYMVVSYQMSLMGGMHKFDVFNEIRRFSDVNGGFLAEYIQTVPKDHLAYREPVKGFKRVTTQVRNIWAACGPDHCVLTQVGRLTLPFPVPQWLAVGLGSAAGKSILGGLLKNSRRAKEKGNPWEGPIAEDTHGFYERLSECSAATESLRRQPPEGAKGCPAGRLDLSQYFMRERFARMGCDDACRHWNSDA